MTSLFSPNSTSLKLKRFRELSRCATMMNNKSRDCGSKTYLWMLLKALIVRSTTQKAEKPFHLRASPDISDPREPERWLIYLLYGTDRLIALATGRDVAHGQGGNQGKYLVL